MESTEQAKDLKSLGSRKTEYLFAGPSKETLETFPNSHPYRDYEIHFATEEFTSLCPKTGQPDFANLHISYIANEKCIESKSLKLYLMQWRSGEGAFMEYITNQILSDLVAVCEPRTMRVEMHFNARGGIATDICAEYRSNEGLPG